MANMFALILALATLVTGDHLVPLSDSDGRRLAGRKFAAGECQTAGAVDDKTLAKVAETAGLG